MITGKKAEVTLHRGCGNARTRSKPDFPRCHRNLARERAAQIVNGSL